MVDSRRDNLVKFCLGILRRAGSDLAVDAVLNELGSRPHLTQSFCHYVAPFVMNSSDIQKALFDFIEKDECIYDWELQWPVAALWAADQIPQKIVTKSLGILNNNQRANELRACCALLIGKFGNGSSRSNLRSHWDSENSDHVRAAMILSTMFFGPGERKVLLNLWGNHKPLFNLIAGAVPKKLSGSP